MQRHVATVAEYLEQVPQPQLPLLEALQALIRKTAPKLSEEIKYGMLGYCDGVGEVISLAAQKHYVGLYVSTQAVATLAEELQDIDHGKCCLRFKRLEQIPTATLRKLLELSLSLRKEEQAAKAAKKRT